MPDILESALNSRVAPGGILVRHPNDQAANLGEDTVPARAGVRVRPLPYDELPMPPSNCVWCHDGGNLTQGLPSQPMSPDRKPSPIGIGELQPLLTQLPSKDPILFHQISEGLPLLTIQPAG
jgi:hypothetical protein